MDPIDALRLAGDEYRRRLVAVGADQWEQPSVCEGWTVKELADHVLGGNRFAVPLLAGTSADEAFGFALGAGFDGDPVVLFDESAVAQLAAFAAPGALEVEVAHPAGPTDGRTFAGLRTGDLILHGWDLARSVGGDEQIEDDLAEEVLRTYEPRLRAAAGQGSFAAPIGRAGDDERASLRLLDLAGRSA